MNLSSIIKSYIDAPKKNEILTARHDSVLEEDSFTALDSLWQSDDTEYVDTMRRLQDEKDRAAQETAAMVAQAKAQVEQIEKEANERGYAAGQETALAEEREKLKEKLAAFDQLALAIEKDRQELHHNYVQDIITLVKTMVDRLLFHEVSVNPKVIQACMKTAMSYVVENSSVNIHLHANDLNRLKEATFERPDLLVGTNQVELTDDPTISEGGCLLETGFGEVDATLESRKEKLYTAIDAVFIKLLAG